MNDYLVMAPSPGNEGEDILVQKIMGVFQECTEGLTFTCERPVEGRIQYFDLSIMQGDRLLAIFKRTKKGLLPYTSAHTKLVKRGIVKSCLNSALHKSCEHMMT